MKTYICAYRDWSLEVYDYISKAFDNIEIIKTQQEFERNVDLFNEDDIIFFIGWSWILPDNIVQKYNCICLHPSPLPKYRGGSPIQHQIINGESKSAVTFFKMTEKLDAGPILYQQEFSLDGNLKDVTLRIKDLAITGIFYILNNNNVMMSAQDESEVTFYKRRTPTESEIFVDDFKKCTAEELYNKIRCLQDPYPNAYITCKDGKRLFIQLAKYEKEK